MALAERCFRHYNNLIGQHRPRSGNYLPLFAVVCFADE